ncbi:MAG: DUF2935 domain-containing protein [Clostridia bacterium]|nr:DUF2935 domain-containing protein [Clostridia bacterium]
MLSPVEELRFWTAIMRDHGEFMLISLSSREQDAIRTAYYYRNSFAVLHEEIKKYLDKPDAPEISTLANNSIPLLTGFINFKQILLRRLLECNMEISLPPTFLNHMINEAMEFFKVLSMLMSPIPVSDVMENIYLHKVWLPDAAGHAASIAAELDPVEKMLIKEAEEFEKCFNCLFIKADELGKMLERTGLDDGTLKHLNEEVRIKIEEFINFLERIYKLREQCKVLGTLKPLIPFHMMREENYYLARVKNVQSK